MNRAPTICLVVTLAASAAASSVSEEDARRYALSLEQAAAERDAARFSESIDWDGLLKDSTAGFGDSAELEEARQAFSQGVTSQMAGVNGFGRAVLQSLGEEGSYTLLRVHRVEGRTRALFRMILGETGALNYHDIELGRTAAGDVIGTDIYVFISGELLSETFRRSFMPVAAEVSRGILDRLVGKQHDFIANLDQVRQVTQAAQAGDHEGAIRAYRALPESLRRDKNLLLVRFAAAQQLGEEAYMAAMDDLETYHPDDPGLKLALFDAYFLRGQFDKVYGCLDALDEAVGGDPYLDLLRANVLVEEDKLSLARDAARKAVEAEPTLEDAYWVLVSISLANREYSDTVKWLDALAEVFDIEFTDLSQIEEYVEFARSPEYQRWVGRQ